MLFLTITSDNAQLAPNKTACSGSDATSTSHKLATPLNWQSRSRASNTQHTNRRIVLSGQSSPSFSSSQTGCPDPSSSNTSRTLSDGQISMKGTVTPSKVARYPALSSLVINVPTRRRNGSPRCNRTTQSCR